MKKFAIGEQVALKIAYAVEQQRHINTQQELLRTRAAIASQAVTALIADCTKMKPEEFANQSFELNDNEIAFPGLEDKES